LPATHRPSIAPRVAASLTSLAIVIAALVPAAAPALVRAASPNVVISQLYGGGGNAGATYTHDFVELFNRGETPQSIDGWTVQYASATGTGTFAQNSPVALSGSIPAGGYFLVRLAGGTTGAPLPTPDISATAPNMSGTAGKVIVASTNTGLTCNGGSAPCTDAQLAQIVDLAGYGNANFFEGSAAAPTLTSTTSAHRADGGCADTDDNAADFAAAAPNARNSATGLNPCESGNSLSIDDVVAAEGSSGVTTFTFTVSLAEPAAPGGVTFDVATADDTATADDDYVARALTAQSIAEGSSTYSFEIAVNGDASVEFGERFFVNLSNVTGSGVADGQGVGTIANDDCGEPFAPIPSIQGTGASAALTGLRATQGVVVGDFEGAAGAGGFYVQDPAGDGNPATSDGIFVFTGTANTASVGDVVRVEGIVRERFAQTAFMGANDNTTPVPPLNVIACGTGDVATTDVTMPFESPTFLERFEGMKVRFPQSLVIAEYFNYGRFGEMVLALPLDGETRPFTGTAIDEPGAAANARTLANSLRRITLDDNQSAQNPPVLRHPNGQPFSLTNSFRGGDHVQNAVGVLGFDFSLYRIFPTGPAQYTASNARPPEPEPVGGTLRVAAMNTLNFFLTLDETPSDSGVPGPCGGNADLDCRGADANADPANDPIVDQELPRQRDKLLQALAGLDADVLGLNELENTPGVDPLADIVAGLNAMNDVGPYATIDTGTIGTDAIKVGLIYNPEVVVPVGSFQVLSSADDPRFIDTKSRPALAQTFEEIATGARFTVVVNHLKSKGSDCLDVDLDPGPGVDPDNDTGDGQGNCNGTRTLAAQALVDWIATDPTGSGDPDFLIMGDLNSYAREDPIDAITVGADDAAGTDDDWTNLIAEHQGTFAYSFVFDGQSGYLDHALANASIAGQVAGAADWHINADEPSVLDYDVSFKPEAQDRLYEADQYRTSDHDPVVVGLDLVNDAPTIEVVAGTSCSTTAIGGTFALTVNDNEQDVDDLALSVEGNSNTALVPNANVVFGGSGANRSVAITTADMTSGSAVLTIGVSDGWNTTDVTITVRVGSGADESLDGTAGADLLAGAAGNDSLTGLGGADVLCGGQGRDSAAGGAGNDAIEGDKGIDILSGGTGNDVLRGGQGEDSLTGGADADAFSGGPGADTNTDFNAGEGDTSDGT
jgi:predicted extracellular nuclease